MASKNGTLPPKHIYRGDPLTEPPPPELAAILAPHRGEPDALITALEEIQRHYGYLGQNHLQYVARELGFPLARVFGVATFYNLFRFEPPGKYQVRVCRGTACHVNRSDEILHALSEHLGVGVDETTADNRFTLQTVACMGACSLAPVVVVDDDTFGRMTPAEALQALGAIELAATAVNGDAA